MLIPVVGLLTRAWSFKGAVHPVKGIHSKEVRRFGLREGEKQGLNDIFSHLYALFFRFSNSASSEALFGLKVSMVLGVYV